MRASASAAPVLLRFPPEEAREAGWGRLQQLTAARALISTQTRLARRERVLLSFELAGERYKDFPAEVLDAERDADGYFSAEVLFLDEVERRRLTRNLLDVLSRG